MQTGKLEAWAGLECTVNRVRDEWHDQSARNGHADREQDLDLFASLGVKKIRYPVLWETAQGDRADGDFDFTWAKKRLARLQTLGIDPIIGLLHHGSGPRTTSLLDPEFPEKLARYAKAVAENFPHITDYTPVNEPLTTARFSGLYGVWYPHGEDDKTMLRCLFNECKGTALAMGEIRKINPRARLVQTDDMGRAQGTAPMQKLVQFQNERRWLTFDLLFGRINQNHPLRSYILSSGITEVELDWFVENPCPPDVIGINHYPLSNRFLDSRIELYPPGMHALDCEVPHIDLGTPQCLDFYPNDPLFKLISPEEILREVCARYDVDVAITEVHIDGPREAQLQWIKEVWKGAQNLNREGARVVAVTIWSLLGSYDWNCLVSECRMYYESGVFDIRSPEPRPTAIAFMTRALATEGDFDHPVLAKPGRWRKTEQISSKGRPILITGRNSLAHAFGRVAYDRYLDYQLLPRRALVTPQFASIRRALEQYRPWAVIDTVRDMKVDEAEHDPERAFHENVIGSEILAAECRRLGIPFLTFSTDLVFDGGDASGDNTDARKPYVETDSRAPLNAYGRTMAEMEERVVATHPGALIVRTSTLFSPWDHDNFVVRALRQIVNGKTVQAPTDLVSSPTYTPDLVRNCLDLVIDGAEGILHLNNLGEMSRAGLVKSMAERLSLDINQVDETSASEMTFTAKRPAYSALASERLRIMPTLADALERCQRDFLREGILY